jgi:tRNA(fMet)-specific endonuclease VapC
MKYLLDTNTCIYIMNRRPLAVVRKFREFDIGDVGVSSITVSELYYGVRKSKRQEENLHRLFAFLLPFEVLPYDESAAGVYGGIRADLERKGEIIGPLDMLIAAHALSRELILITNNVREFRRVQGLQLENWIS